VVRRKRVSLGMKTLSPLPGLIFAAMRYPAINRWAIIGRPCRGFGDDTIIASSLIASSLPGLWRRTVIASPYRALEVIALRLDYIADCF
jgi:hypothetical protein